MEMASWAGRTLKYASDSMLRSIAGLILALWRHYWKKR
jgi:hypothetical protein